MSTIRVDKIMPFQSSSVEILGSFNGTYTGSFTGSFVGDGSGLTGITAGASIDSSSFATTGSNVFHGSQTISGSLTATGFAFAGAVIVNSGSSNTSLGPNSIRLEHSSSEGNHKIIGLSAEPTHLNQAGLANVTEPSLFTADSSSNFYQVMEFQSLGRFPENKVSIKVPVDVSGSMLVSGSARFTSAITASSFTGSFVGDGSGLTGIAGSINTGSFATTGSNTFIGTETVSGSILVSGSVNADGFELDTTSTTTIPALNSTFNLNLSGSGEYGGDNFIKKALVLGDGKVLIAGRFQTIDGHITNDIARLNSNGTIDTSFSSPIFGYEFGEYYGYINTFVTQSDGKILVGGTFTEVSGSNRRGLARLNSNGTLDTSFATQSWGSFGEVHDIVIQNDGKIVCVGYFTSGSRRINTDGTFDTSFNLGTGNNQPWFFDNEYFYSVALLDSGSEQAILIGGNFAQWGSYSDYNNLVKLNPNGTLDFGFAGTNLNIDWNSDGYTAGDKIKKIKVGDDGNIYIAGRFKDTLSGPNVRNAGFAIVTPDDIGYGRGAFDSGFRTYISGASVNDFDFYDGNKILLGGDFTTFGIPGYSTTSANRFAIVSQTTGNIISGWFASGSASTYNLNTGSVNSVTLLSGDNVLVGGTFTSASFPSTAREGLASFKLTGFGNVTTTSEYAITADSTRLLVSSSTTQFSGDVIIVGNVTASEFSGSFVGDGSGLTGLSTINTGSFATTGSNTFKGEQIISSSLLVTDIIKGTGSIRLQPDINEDRGIEIYNTSATDVHIKSTSGLTFLGDDSNYVLIDSYTEKVSIAGPNGVVVSGSLNVSGSNTFVGNQTISGSVRVSGSISQRGIGNGNIIIGEDPLTNLNSTAEFNTIIGADAGALLRSGSSNVFVGRMAGLRTDDSNSNVFIGHYAGYENKGSQNVYIGEAAGFSNISGRYNIAIGHNAGYNNKVDLNTFIGFQSGFQNTSGSGNTFVGERTGESNTIGNNNSFFGGSSGRDNSVGNNNTFIGQNAGQQNTSGSQNTFVGSQAGSYTTTGGNNTFVGISAGAVNTVGYSNAFFGDNSGFNNTTAYENTFIGSFSGHGNKTGVENTFVGTSAGQNNGVGSDNTYIGHRAGNSNISGSNNTLVGKSAGSANTVGNRNTLLGTEASYVATSGDDNLMLGYRAGAQQISGASITNSNTSIFLGSNARGDNNASNQIVIGALAEGNGSNTTTIGNSSTTATYLKGTLNVSTAILAQVSSSYNFADDAAAATGGVPLGGLYHTSGSIKIRLV
jgi:uncharacterized delta-60 repeat protein